MPRLIGHKTIAFALLYTLVTVAEDTSKDSKYYGGDSDGIAFPGPINDRSRSVKSADLSAQEHDRRKEMISLARKINSAETIDEMLQLIGYSEAPTFALDNIQEQIVGYNYFEECNHILKSEHSSFSALPQVEKKQCRSRSYGPLLNIRQNGRMGQRSNAEKPKPAKCIPELQPVSFKHENDTSNMYIPECTRIMRCGGCCTHESFSCQPIASITRNFEVFVTTIFDFHTQKQIVPLEEHTECVCDCKIKEKDCNERQEYVPDDCLCRCKNTDEQTKCLQNNDTKIWKTNQCTCVCRQVLECSTGFFFDQNTCRCEPEKRIY